MADSPNDSNLFFTKPILELRCEIDKWRQIDNPVNWKVTPETARLLQHRRGDHFSSIRPFFCQIEAVEVFQPSTGEVRSDGADGIACWFIDTDYNEESFFVRQAYFLGANDPYKSLRTTLKAEIDKEAWDSLNSDTSRPFPPPRSGRIAVKVINHLGDEVMKVFRVKEVLE